MNEREQQQFKKEKLKIDSVITIVVITACLGIIRSSVLHKKGLYSSHTGAKHTKKKMAWLLFRPSPTNITMHQAPWPNTSQRTKQIERKKLGLKGISLLAENTDISYNFIRSFFIFACSPLKCVCVVDWWDCACTHAQHNNTQYWCVSSSKTSNLRQLYRRVLSECV